MDIRALRYFVEVVKQQSFTRAAEKLFVTQPTISKMLRQLEEELACTLINREGRRFYLTDAGQAVYQRGLAILHEFHALESEISDRNTLKTGELRLGIPPMSGMQIAGPIADFHQLYPGIELKISEFGGLMLQEEVLSGRLDLALTALPTGDDLPLNILPLVSFPLCVLVTRTSNWFCRNSVSLAEAANYPVLIYNEAFSLHRQLTNAFRQQALTLQVVVQSGQWDFLAAMVQAGMGIAILPEPVCQRLDKQTLKWLPLEADIAWTLGLIWRRGSYLSRSAQAFLSCCQRHWPQATA